VGRLPLEPIGRTIRIIVGQQPSVRGPVDKPASHGGGFGRQNNVFSSREPGLVDKPPSPRGVDPETETEGGGGAGAGSGGGGPIDKKAELKKGRRIDIRRDESLRLELPARAGGSARVPKLTGLGVRIAGFVDDVVQDAVGGVDIGILRIETGSPAPTG